MHTPFPRFPFSRVLALLPVPAVALLMISLSGCSCEADAPEADENGQDEFELIVQDRSGALVDEVVFLREEEEGRVPDEISTGNMHVYGQGISTRTVFDRIRANDDVDYGESYGSFNELTLNPAGPYFDDGRLNPFHSRRFREAVNWFVDRDHIVDMILDGMGRPRYTMLNQLFPDYARLVTTARELEAYYAYNPERAERIFAEELEKMGAEQDEDGNWLYDGEQVRISVLMRTEDERREIGDYIANKFDQFGFDVRSNPRNAREASRIWISGNPNSGEWNVYTGGWISTRILRDQAENFNFHYTHRGRSEPLWREYDPFPHLEAHAEELDLEEEARKLQRREYDGEEEREALLETFAEAIGGEEWEELAEWIEFDYIADKLQRRDYETWEERMELMRLATRMSIRQSPRVWLFDRRSIWPHADNVGVAIDLAGGVSGSRLWPYTLHFQNRVGGSIRFGSPQILVEPWNPIEGSNWLFDTMIERALEDPPLMADPYTGLFHPQRIREADVLVREGRPVNATLDWINLYEEQPETVEVPEDTWIDWDPEERRIVTVGEKYPDGLTTNAMVRLHYEEGYFDRTWHDGTQVSMADLVMYWIYVRERGDHEDGKLYDFAYGPTYQAFRRHYRGMRIVSEDPLVIEVYGDQVNPDAEELAFLRVPGITPWHKLTLGIMAEKNEELAFGSNKADHEDVEWTNYIAGDSLPILDRMLGRAIDREYIPFEETMREWVSEEELRDRYAAINEWREERGHYWVGDGPFYVHAVHPGQDQVILRRWGQYPDAADKWLRFDRPMEPFVEILDRAPVILGEATDFEVQVLFEGRPYPEEYIEEARYLLFDGRGDLVSQGNLVDRGSGQWAVELSVEEVDALGRGTNRLDVIVISDRVASPAIETMAFPTRHGD